MSNEFTGFRTKLKAWLESISAVASACGSRVYSAMPAKQPTYPMIAYVLRSRRSLTDVGSPAWSFVTEMALYGPLLDTLETVHDAIIEAVSNNPETILGTLSLADVVTCTMFQYEDSDEDPHEAFVEQGQTVHALLMRFPTTIVKPSGGW